MSGNLQKVAVAVLWMQQQEAFIEECELLRADILENELVVEGEYVSEKVMREDWSWSELLA